ncbi:MAG: primosomal protein N' [Oscillospiraceae bacterium]|nr:primosomal protein N' [Oscillospiraceae bacterium]
MPAISKIAVSSATYHIDKPYDYIIPEQFIDKASPGMRVMVPFGKGNKISPGVILSVGESSELTKLKSISSFLDDEPIYSDENLRLALWMSDRFFCTVFDALRVMLPAGMWSFRGARRVGDITTNVVVLKISNDEAITFANEKEKSAPRQAAIMKLLASTESMSLRELCFITQSTSATVKTLEKQGLIYIENHEKFRRPEVSPHVKSQNITLNNEQSAAFYKLLDLLKSNEPEAALLYGVTGSGKTHVYIKLIEAALLLDKTAIVLVPEIALTPQLVGIFAAYFGDLIAVLHSALSLGERYDEWKRIRRGAVRVVVGTRLAVFAPISNIGLIVIDEEQEHTYKSESSPRYHARDIAKHRVTRAGGLLLLSSATPSVDSMYNALSNNYTLVEILKRYNERELPSVITIDMKDEAKNGNGGSLSDLLVNELDKNIKNDEQSILFINRRGTNPFIVCDHCGYTYHCRYCSVSMTYHLTNKRLLCHYCGYSIPEPTNCPECMGKLKYFGAGTQKIESELLEAFPDISIIRMDADTVSRKNSHDVLLSRFRENKANILLGTQMVTKGLDFDNVTLVGVVSADTMLNMGDFRAHERTFSLITQVVGRSGRGDKLGRAVIQTYSPNHEVIMLASKQDYFAFYEREILYRRTLASPPFKDLISLTVSGIDENMIIASCNKLRYALEEYFRNDRETKLLGPAPAPVMKVKNQYRYRVMVSCENNKNTRQIIAHTVKEFMRTKESKGITVFADADAYD